MSDATVKLTLDQWRAKLESANTLVGVIAEGMVPVVGEELKTAQAEQRSPDGVAWKPTKAGTPAYKGWANQTSIEAIAKSVLITITGPLVYALFGTKKMPSRPILPAGALKGRLGDAIKNGVVSLGKEWMERRGSHNSRHNRQWGKAAPTTGSK